MRSAHGSCACTRSRKTPNRRCGSKLDSVYFQRHSADEIAWHARQLCFRVDGQAPVVKARLSRAGVGLQVMIYLPDQKALFARICGFFGQARLSILDAKVHTTRHGYALDTFTVHDPANPNASYRDAIGFIEFELKRVLSEARAAAAARGWTHQPAAEAFSALTRSAALSGRQGHALHSGDRRRRPAGPPRAHRVYARPARTSTWRAPRSIRSASAPRTSSSSTARACTTRRHWCGSKPRCTSSCASRSRLALVG